MHLQFDNLFSCTISPFIFNVSEDILGYQTYFVLNFHFPFCIFLYFLPISWHIGIVIFILVFIQCFTFVLFSASKI